MITPGVYAITHLESGRVYIGSSKDVRRRFVQHRRALVRGKHRNRRLQFAWDTDGPDGFTFAMIEAAPVDCLLDREDHHIQATEALNPTRGFNVVPWTTGGGVPGHEVTQETREKIRAALVGRPQPPRSAETCRRISEAQRGKVIPAATIEKMRASKTGHKFGPMADEHKAKIGARQREAWIRRKERLGPSGGCHNNRFHKKQEA